MKRSTIISIVGFIFCLIGVVVPLLTGIYAPLGYLTPVGFIVVIFGFIMGRNEKRS